jgi:hypothetical protein
VQSLLQLQVRDRKGPAVSIRSAASLIAGAVVVIAITSAPRAVATPPPPNVLVALGGGASAGRDSWATSTKPAVESLARRLDARWQRSLGRGLARIQNLARPDFAVADLQRQAKLAVALAPGGYVTVDPGLRDLCSGTSLASFRSALARGLRILSSRRPTITTTDSSPILLVSIEDLTREWSVIRSSPAGARMLKVGHHLACGLGYDVSPARLRQIRERTSAFNKVLAEVCFRHHVCLYDNGLRFRMTLKRSYFSRDSLGQLSARGERALAALEWTPAKALISVSIG